MRFAERVGDYYGMEVRVSGLVPEGQILVGRGSVIFANLLTRWSLLHEGRYPMLSRYSPGVIALERDRRRCG